MSDWWNRPTSPGPEAEATDAADKDSLRCPWCSAVASPNQACCPSCGAVMAQRESLGGLVIPGVTDVDADLGDPSLAGSLLGSQSRMNAIGAVSQAVGPAAGLASAAVLLARDSVGGMFRETPRPEDVGRPSQAALDMANRLGATEGDTSTARGDQPEPVWTEPKDPA